MSKIWGCLKNMIIGYIALIVLCNLPAILLAIGQFLIIVLTMSVMAIGSILTALILGFLAGSAFVARQCKNRVCEQ